MGLEQSGHEGWEGGANNSLFLVFAKAVSVPFCLTNDLSKLALLGLILMTKES